MTSKGHDNLYISTLPAEFVIRNFVKGMPESNYEVFLTEYLNKSSFFMNKTAGKGFVYQHEQSEGQCDCYSFIGAEKYGIDFKLFGSQRGLQAKSIFSNQRHRYADGVYGTSTPKSKNGQITATWMLAALKNKTVEDLERINQTSKNPAEDEVIIDDIRSLLNTMHVEKNLFLFLTYRFYFHSDYQFNYQAELEDLVVSQTERLKGLIEYRGKYGQRFDTYYSFIFEDYLIITEFRDKKVMLVDQLSLSQSATFMVLNDLLLPPNRIVVNH